MSYLELITQVEVSYQCCSDWKNRRYVRDVDILLSMVLLNIMKNKSNISQRGKFDTAFGIVDGVVLVVA